MKINNGLVEGVKFVPSPNHGGTITPKFITCHYTAGWTAASAIATLTNPANQVSAHFVIDRDGTVTQLVCCDQRAWHAGPSKFMGYNDMNTHSIGIEFVNPGFIYAVSVGGYIDSTKKTVPASALQGYDLSVVRSHPRIGPREAIWPAYTAAQIKAGAELVEAICAKYNILGLNSHEEIDTRGWKTDPGFSFPIGEFKAMCDKFEGRAGSGIRPPAIGMAVVNADKLNVRSSPNGPSIGVFKNGDTLVILEDTGEWVRVNGPQFVGWVADKFLSHK